MTGSVLCVCMYEASSQPVISGPRSWHVTVGQVFSAQYTANNSDGSAVTMSMSGLPVGAVFVATTGVISWTPRTTDAVPSVRSDSTHAHTRTLTTHGVVCITVYVCTMV
jgi:hypothetical protein